MEHLTLVRPTQAMREALLDYRAEHFAQGETVLHGGAQLERMEYEDWLRRTEENARPETVHSDWVAASTFAVVRREDGRVVGMADIRHTLNAFLRAYGGHIGVGVRPSERKKAMASRSCGWRWPMHAPFLWSRSWWPATGRTPAPGP